MDVTRRSLARLLAAAAVIPQPAESQTAEPSNADLESAHEVLKKNLAQIAKVKVPVATEPACHFKA